MRSLLWLLYLLCPLHAPHASSCHACAQTLINVSSRLPSLFARAFSTELHLALLTLLSDVSHNAANVQVESSFLSHTCLAPSSCVPPTIAVVLLPIRLWQVLVKENGTAVILASVLAHLKNDALLLPALQLLVHITRQPNHIPTLVREGGVPAVLAAILAHLRRVEVLRAALVVLRNIVADDISAMRLGGQGAYRIVFAVLQTHATVHASARRESLPLPPTHATW